MIPHSRPSLGPEEKAAACRVIASGILAQGAEVAALEAELAALLGVDHAVAVSSGSAALHLGLLAMELRAGDEVVVPSYVCAALLHAVQHVGATPLLADIDSATHNLCPHDARKRLSPHTRALIVPHMFGRAADIGALLELGVPVVEDCAMCIGAECGGRKLGSHGAMAVVSFYATKVVCAGEGGAVVTSDPDLADRIRDLREYDGRSDPGPRFNYKLTDLQAALARAQLRKLEGFLGRRRALGLRYARELARTSGQLPHFGPGDFPFRYVVRHPRGAEELIPRFESAGVAVRSPIFRPLHRYLGHADRDYPATTAAFRDAISLPLYPSLSEDEVGRILAAAQEIL